MNEQEQRKSKALTTGFRIGPVVFADMRDRAREIAGLPPPPKVTGEIDPLFVRVRNTLAEIGLVDAAITHTDGIFPSQTGSALTELTGKERILAAVFGLLVRDNATNPKSENYDQTVSSAIGEYTKSRDLFNAVLNVLIESGFVPGTASPNATANNIAGQFDVQSKWWAAVTRNVREQGLNANDPHLDEITREVLVNFRSADGGLTPSTIEIDLPDLEKSADIEIVPANLQATQALYFSSMLEELRVFQVVDRLIELFHQGMLPLGKGKAGDFLYRYWKQSEQRLTEAERRNLYARAFGFPGGDSDGAVNREFNDLWLRFVSAVSSYLRQNSLDDLLTRKVAGSISQEQVRKAGRDLAANLSLHGYGIAYFAATELQGQIKEIRDLLSDPEIKMAFGARDMFQVIDQVATLELGGAKNSIRYRTMAQSGAIIIRWLANRAELLSASGYRPPLNFDDIKNAKSGIKPTVDPTDFDLVNACEQWLAVTGTPDQKVEEYSQPSEPPMMTSRPINIPSAARDLLDSVGISAGLSATGRAMRSGGGNRSPHVGHAGSGYGR